MKRNRRHVFDGYGYLRANRTRVFQNGHPKESGQNEYGLKDIGLIK